MPRWLRIARGMIGTGLTFAAGVGGVVAILGALGWLGGGVAALDVLRIAGRFAVVAFLLGVAFGGTLAMAARAGGFRRLTLGRVGALGAGVGVLYWGFLASTGGRVWSPRVALLNFGVLVAMGGGAAIATLLLARRAGAGLGAGEEPSVLAAGDAERSVRAGDDAGRQLHRGDAEDAEHDRARERDASRVPRA